MHKRLFALTLGLLLLGCSSSKREEKPIVSSPYTFEIELTTDIDTSLVRTFNKYVVDERIPELKGFGTGRAFPQIFPNVLLLSVDYYPGKIGEAMSVCYDTLTRRFYPIFDRSFLFGFNEMVEDQLQGEITEDQAFLIAACAVFIRHHPRAIVSRPADLFLEERLREYMHEAYSPEPGIIQKEFSNWWWGWVAFPSANDDYTAFYNAYRDSILSDEVLWDLPESTLELPKVERDGVYYVVTFYGLPPSSRVREIYRYRLRITADGEIRKENADLVFYF